MRYNEEVEIKYLCAYLGYNVWAEDICFSNSKVDTSKYDYEICELINDFPSLHAAQYDDAYIGLCLKINVDTGKVENWPEELGEASFRNVKIVDSGVYSLVDEEGNEVTCKEGYVPRCLQIEENGFGDYLEFYINKDGFIDNWKFDQDDLEEFQQIS